MNVHDSPPVHAWYAAGLGRCAALVTGPASPAPPGLSAEHIYILAGVSMAFLLCLLLLIIFLLRQHQKKHSRSQEEGGVTWAGCLGCWEEGWS